MERTGKVTRRIAAHSAAVYELVSDVTQVGLWAVECESCQWLDEATGPAVGARFRGVNRFAEHTWSTVSVVDEVVPDQRFSFHTEGMDGQPLTRWHFTLKPDGDATILTEGFERVALPDPDEEAFENEQFGGRSRRNLANIAASLERLAALVESG